MHDDDYEAMGPVPTLAPGEYLIWKGKPKRSAYIADKALSMLPIAVFWAIFDFNFLRMAGGNGMLLIFLAVHMMPVWLWIGSAVTSVIQWRNEDYFLTNKRIIIRKGVFGPNKQSVFLRDVHTVDIHYGLLDRMFGSGDIYINYAVHRHGKHRSTSGYFLMNLADPTTIQEKLEQAAMAADPAERGEEIYD